MAASRNLLKNPNQSTILPIWKPGTTVFPEPVVVELPQLCLFQEIPYLSLLFSVRRWQAYKVELILQLQRFPPIFDLMAFTTSA